MKKHIISSAIAMALLAGFSSCSDFLESSNKSTVTADAQFGSPTGWNQLLNQSYYAMRSIYSNPLLYGAGTDMYGMSQGTAPTVLHTYQYPANYGDVEELYKNLYAAINYSNAVLKYSSDEKLNDEARFIRAYCYYILTQQYGGVPYITSYIESAADNYPRTDLATCYDNIISDLNDVISRGVLSNTSSAADGRGRASIQGAKALLAKVYLAAGWDIQTSLNDAAKGTYTVNSTAYFEKAAKLAAEVADNVPLTQSFADKWDFDKNENGQNEETLFAIQYNRATSSDKVKGGHDQQHYFGGYMGSNTLGVKALRNGLCPTERVYYAYEPGDERYEASFMTTIYAYDGDASKWSKSGYWGFFNTTDAEKAALKVSWKFFPWYTATADIDQYITDNASKFVTTGMKTPTKVIHVADQLTTKAFKADGSADATASANNSMSLTNAIAKIGLVPPVKKFDDKNTTSEVSQSGGCYRDIVVLNVSEIYLVAAEAYLMINDETNALKYLNAVRSRAKASALGSFSEYKRFDWAKGTNGDYVTLGEVDSNNLTLTKLDVILDERMRETLGEYYRWMDLRRTKQLVRYNVAFNGLTVANMTGTDGQIKWLRPIPANEIKLNTGISEADQNPGFVTQ